MSIVIVVVAILLVILHNSVFVVVAFDVALSAVITFARHGLVEGVWVVGRVVGGGF